MSRVPKLGRSVAMLTVILLVAVGCSDSKPTASSTSGSGGSSAANVTNGFESADDGVHKDSIDWGTITDITGPTASTQVPYLHGVESFMNATNAAGGVFGRKINLIKEDDKFVSSADKDLFETLNTQTPVLGITGISNSTAQVALKDELASAGVPVLGSQTVTTDLVSPTNPNYFAAYCGNSVMGAVGAGHEIDALKLTNPKAVAVVLAQNAGGVEFSDALQKTVEAAGGSFLGKIEIAGTATDATAQAQQLANLKPDFVGTQGSVTTITLLMKALEQLGINVPVVGVGNSVTTAVYEAISPATGANLTMVHCFTPSGSEDVPGMKAMQDGAQASGYTADMANNANFTAGWVQAMLAVEAIKAAGPSPTRAKIVAALNNNFSLDTQGLSPNLHYSQNDHNAIVTERAYKYDYTKKSFQAIGTYDDYAKYFAPLKPKG